MQSVQLVIDGRPVRVPTGTTIWQAAERVGIEIPTLCHQPHVTPVGVCRLCVVDVGERVLAASCVRACEAGMEVQTDSATVRGHRGGLLELLLREHPLPCERERTTGDCELEALGRAGGILPERPSGSTGPAGSVPVWRGPALETVRRPTDVSSPVIAVDHQACILCDRCVRACNEVQSNEVIGRTGKGSSAQIAFDLNDPMGRSSCVACGECAASCPTGALTDRAVNLPLLPRSELRSVDSVCPYCGVGCAVTFHTTHGALSPAESSGSSSSRDRGTAPPPQIVFADGRASPVNHGRLCVKGRYGWDYASHPQRLTRPLIRRDSHYPKGPLSAEVASSTQPPNRKPGGIVDYDEVLPAFREASWEEALDLVAGRLQAVRAEFGSSAIAGFGSAKCSNEEAYLFQKLIRAGWGTNNVDHCTRLCHASSVAALMETIGSGAVTNVFADVAQSDVALVAGSNTTANHPVAATFIKQAAKRGTKLIVVDVREHPLIQFADHFVRLRAGTDVAFYNAVMHVLIREDLIDEAFIASRTEGFDDLRAVVLEHYAPDQVASVCGVAVEEIERVARVIGKAGSMLVFWGMGISQHTTGTDNARCLISLCLLTGNIGRPGTGLHPLRGQNNVQGASDAGLIPMVYPDYQSVGDAPVREKFSRAWGKSLDDRPGLTVVEILGAALKRSVRGMYILGENPFISDPNLNKVRRALARLDFLVVQDIFLTETAEFADVILPASSYLEKTGTYTNTDRRVQLGRSVLRPPGEARQDWSILCDVGRRIGLSMDYPTVADVFREFASLTKNYRTLSHENLGETGKLWPCPDPLVGDGTQILFGEDFPTASGKGKFVPCRYQPADELPDREYPFVLNTGRVLEHWHTGTMTRRSQALSQLEPAPFVAIHPSDLQALGVEHGDRVRISSRRGVIELAARADRSIEPGNVFVPFHFREAAANVLTSDALDPYGKIPEFKVCAVQIAPLA